jgi:hypothetical protein
VGVARPRIDFVRSAHKIARPLRQSAIPMISDRAREPAYEIDDGRRVGVVVFACDHVVLAADAYVLRMWNESPEVADSLRRDEFAVAAIYDQGGHRDERRRGAHIVFKFASPDTTFSRSEGGIPMPSQAPVLAKPQAAFQFGR